MVAYFENYDSIAEELERNLKKRYPLISWSVMRKREIEDEPLWYNSFKVIGFVFVSGQKLIIGKYINRLPNMDFIMANIANDFAFGFAKKILEYKDE
jgi:hypothetical protein